MATEFSSFILPDTSSVTDDANCDSGRLLHWSEFCKGEEFIICIAAGFKDFSDESASWLECVGDTGEGSELSDSSSGNNSFLRAGQGKCNSLFRGTAAGTNSKRCGGGCVTDNNSMHCGGGCVTGTTAKEFDGT